jgi:uncharacterized membrane protein YfcA
MASNLLLLLGIGFTGGIMGGLLGVGGGFLMVPLQVLLAKVPQRKANATSLAAIIPISVVGGLVYYFGGKQPAVDLRLALEFVVGSVVGVYLGARLLSSIPEPILKGSVAVLLLLAAAKELVAP